MAGRPPPRRSPHVLAVPRISYRRPRPVPALAFARQHLDHAGRMAHRHPPTAATQDRGAPTDQRGDRGPERPGAHRHPAQRRHRHRDPGSILGQRRGRLCDARHDPARRQTARLHP
ncbi:hypothetical protein G6F40_016345 [Rhizopus arrhizus]|nr:hypothetical protein G6F40_016345 [Rhizopus arrhizus]